MNDWEALHGALGDDAEELLKETEQSEPSEVSPPLPCSALSAGDVIQRGDLFRADDGRMLEMDNLGRLLGVPVLGQTLKKGGDWFRASPNSQLSCEAKRSHD